MFTPKLHQLLINSFDRQTQTHTDVTRNNTSFAEHARLDKYIELIIDIVMVTSADEEDWCNCLAAL